MSLDKVESSNSISKPHMWEASTKIFGACSRIHRRSQASERVVLAFSILVSHFEFSPLRGKSPLCELPAA